MQFLKVFKSIMNLYNGLMFLFLKWNCNVIRSLWLMCKISVNAIFYVVLYPLQLACYTICVIVFLRRREKRPVCFLNNDLFYGTMKLFNRPICREIIIKLFWSASYLQALALQCNTSWQNKELQKWLCKLVAKVK